MRQLLLRLLAFILGIEFSSAKELERKGRQLIGKRIEKFVSQRVGAVRLKALHSLGAIEYSKDTLEDVERNLSKGIVPEFTFPTFDPSKDYIDFYYILTDDSRYFVLAFENRYAFAKSDEVLMFVEIKERLGADHLKTSINYLDQ